MCKQQTQQQLTRVMMADVIPPKSSIAARTVTMRSNQIPSVTTPAAQNVRLGQYQSKRIREKVKAIVNPDHNFEWYDLDAIRSAIKSGNSNHNFYAGPVFTTERQMLNEAVQANIVNSTPSSGMNVRRENRQQKFDFDLFFWANKETKEDREFREQIEEMEQEVKSDSPLSSSLSVSSSTSSSSFW